MVFAPERTARGDARAHDWGGSMNRRGFFVSLLSIIMAPFAFAVRPPRAAKPTPFGPVPIDALKIEYDAVRWSNIPIPAHDQWYAVWMPDGRTEGHRWGGEKLHVRCRNTNGEWDT